MASVIGRINRRDDADLGSMAHLPPDKPRRYSVVWTVCEAGPGFLVLNAK